MKKALALLTILLLLTGAQADTILYDKTIEGSGDAALQEGAPVLEVWFPKIYGCDAALVRMGDAAVLIDGGTPDQAPEILRMLKMAGVVHLDAAINSHPDPDHMGGYRVIFAEVRPEKVITGFPEAGLQDPENQKWQTKLYDWMQERDIPIERMQDGEILPLAQAQIRMLQNYDEGNAGINNSSLMCMVSYQDRRVLFTGDIQLPTQRFLVQTGADIRADILKFSHHGYRGADQTYIETVDPVLCVLTGGFRSSEPARMQLREMKRKFAVTDRGILKFTTDGQIWIMERF